MAKKKKKDNTYGSGLEKELDSIMGTDVKINRKSSNNSSNAGGKKQTKQQKNAPVKKKRKEGINIGYVVGGCAAVAIVALGVLAGTYLYRAQQYKTVFFPNTTINSIDCSGKTVEEVEEIIRSSVEDYTLSVQLSLIHI